MQSKEDESLPAFHMLVTASLDADLADLLGIVGRIAKLSVPLIEKDAEYQRALEERGIERSASAATDLQRVADTATQAAAVQVAQLEARLGFLETENASLRAQLQTPGAGTNASAVESDDGGH